MKKYIVIQLILISNFVFSQEIDVMPNSPEEDFYYEYDYYKRPINDTLIFTGKVLNTANNKPLPCVKLKIKSNDTLIVGSWTDFNGMYKIILDKNEISTNSAIIELTYINNYKVLKSIVIENNKKIEIDFDIMIKEDSVSFYRKVMEFNNSPFRYY